jgi:hypothetical protein
MFISEWRYTYEIIAVIIAFLAPDTDLKFIMTRGTGSLQEVLRQKLALLIELVTSPLVNYI